MQYRGFYTFINGGIPVKSTYRSCLLKCHFLQRPNVMPYITVPKPISMARTICKRLFICIQYCTVYEGTFQSKCALQFGDLLELSKLIPMVIGDVTSCMPNPRQCQCKPTIVCSYSNLSLSRSCLYLSKMGLSTPRWLS